MGEPLQPTRHLSLEGSYNVRDLGGYQTSDGRTTRWNVFLRADSMHKLPPKSQAALIDYGIRTVIDLRKSTELEEKPNVFSDPSPQVKYYHQELIGTQSMGEVADSPPPEDLPAKRAWGYAAILDHRSAQVRETLATLSAPGARPALFHCAGGTDRTGIIAALILGIGGVPAETIAEDYTLSARHLVHLFADEEKVQIEAGSPLKEYTWKRFREELCTPEVMLMMLQHLAEKYGGIEAYMRTIGVTDGQIGSLREAIVE